MAESYEIKNALGHAVLVKDVQYVIIIPVSHLVTEKWLMSQSVY